MSSALSSVLPERRLSSVLARRPSVARPSMHAAHAAQVEQSLKRGSSAYTFDTGLANEDVSAREGSGCRHVPSQPPPPVLHAPSPAGPQRYWYLTINLHPFNMALSLSCRCRSTLRATTCSSLHRLVVRSTFIILIT